MKNNKNNEMIYELLDKILNVHFHDENPFKDDKLYVLKYPNDYKEYENYSSKVINYYRNRLIDNGFNKNKIIEIFGNEIPSSNILPYSSISSIDDLMRRFRLLLILFRYTDVINMIKERDFIETISNIESFSNSINRTFINTNHIYLRTVTDDDNTKYEMKMIKNNHFLTDRIRIIIDTNKLSISDNKYRNFLDSKTNYIIGVLSKYFLSENSSSILYHLIEDDKKSIIEAVMYLCTNKMPSKIYKKSSDVLKVITNDDFIRYDTVTDKYQITWDTLSNYIKNNMSASFKIWLDCNPYTHPCATYDNYFFVQAMEFIYVMTTSRSPHSNKFRLEKFMEQIFVFHLSDN